MTTRYLSNWARSSCNTATNGYDGWLRYGIVKNISSTAVLLRTTWYHVPGTSVALQVLRSFLANGRNGRWMNAWMRWCLHIIPGSYLYIFVFNGHDLLHHHSLFLGCSVRCCAASYMAFFVQAACRLALGPRSLLMARYGSDWRGVCARSADDSMGKERPSVLYDGS